MATKNGGLNLTNLLISEKRWERERRERPRARIIKRRSSEEDRRREGLLHLETCLNSAWQNSEVAKRTGDFGNYIKNRCFRKFLLKADYLIPAYSETCIKRTPY